MSHAVLFLDYGTPKLHIARQGEAFASWPSSACGIVREKGRPKTFWDRLDYLPTETCQRCLADQVKRGG